MEMMRHLDEHDVKKSEMMLVDERKRTLDQKGYRWLIFYNNRLRTHDNTHLIPLPKKKRTGRIQKRFDQD